MARSRLVVTALAVTLFSCSAAAAPDNGDMQDVQVRLHAGILSGESGEYVYDAPGDYSGIPGYKLSELQWEIDSVTMIGVGFTIAPVPDLSLSLDYWRNAGDGDGTMDDYDWLYVGYDWSHWSHHPDTRARRVSRLDLGGSYAFYRDLTKTTSLSLLFGYRRDHIDWLASGGSGIYSVDAYRDTQVSFSSVPVIAYEQTFDTPYFGLGVETAVSASGLELLLSAGVRYSRWVRGSDEDIHYLRDLKFEEDGSGGEWLALDIGLELELDRQLSLLFGYNWQEYQEIKASTLITDLVTGERYYYPGDAAGLDHSSRMLNIGLNYRF